MINFYKYKTKKTNIEDLNYNFITKLLFNIIIICFTLPIFVSFNIWKSNNTTSFKNIKMVDNGNEYIYMSKELEMNEYQWNQWKIILNNEKQEFNEEQEIIENYENKETQKTLSLENKNKVLFQNSTYNQAIISNLSSNNKNMICYMWKCSSYKDTPMQDVFNHDIALSIMEKEIMAMNSDWCDEYNSRFLCERNKWFFWHNCNRKYETFGDKCLFGDFYNWTYDIKVKEGDIITIYDNNWVKFEYIVTKLSIVDENQEWIEYMNTTLKQVSNKIQIMTCYPWWTDNNITQRLIVEASFQNMYYWP